MTTQQFKDALTTEQAAALNSILVEQRDGLVASFQTSLRDYKATRQAEIDAGVARVAELAGSMQQAATAHQTALDALKAEHKTALDALQAKLTDALKPKPTPEPVASPLIGELHAAFMAAIPVELRPQFAGPYAIVRTLIQAEQFELAVDFINSIPVPPELEAARDDLVALILGN